MSQYFETILQVRVLTEECAPDTGDLGAIAYQMDEGDYVGDVTVISERKLSTGEMVTALEEVGSDDSFFMGCEGKDAKPIDPKKGKGTWLIVGRIPYEEDETLVFSNVTLAEAKKSFEKALYDGNDYSKKEMKETHGTTIYHTSIIRVNGTVDIIESGGW